MNKAVKHEACADSVNAPQGAQASDPPNSFYRTRPATEADLRLFSEEGRANILRARELVARSRATKPLLDKLCQQGARRKVDLYLVFAALAGIMAMCPPNS